MADTHKCPGPGCKRGGMEMAERIPILLDEIDLRRYLACSEDVAAEERHDRAMHAAIETMRDISRG